MTWENSKFRLLVEGSDDKHCVIHLMKRHGINWDDPQATHPCVHDCGGIEGLFDSLGVAAKSYSRLGFIVDANADIQHRWTQAKEALARIDITLPQFPSVEGVIVPGIFPDWRVGAWLMPDNQSRGQIEDFLAKLIPSGDPCWDYAQEATNQAMKLGARVSHTDVSKANIHTWLAWQENPGVPFGTALTARYFSVNSPEALRLVHWFRQLFS